MRRERKYNEEQINNSIAELNEYRLRLKNLERLRSQRDELQDQYSAGIAVYDAIRVQGGEIKNKLVDLVIKWADLDVAVKNEERECNHLRWCIEEKLHHLEPLKAQVLTLYYLKCYDLGKVISALHYSNRQVCRLKKDALQDYAKVVL